MRTIAIFASGSGSNAENIIRHFQSNPSIRIDSVWSNKKDAFVLERAKNLGVEANFFTREAFSGSDQLRDELQSRGVEVIILAGFLWLIPSAFIDSFELINIHPALLPKYGGKGMYGSHVHEAVIQNKEKESGITIHLVNNDYDKGEHLLQKTCPVYPDDSPETLAERIHKLEYAYFPAAIEAYLLK